jgi:hypothetical protein
MGKLFDLHHPFFAPLWRRIAVTLLCLGWGLFEFVMGSPFWGTLFAGLGAYCAWVFLFDYKPQAEPEKKTE